MPKATRVHSTPRRTASEIKPQKPIERHAHPACPVVDLSQQLMDLWDADDASQRVYFKEEIHRPAGDLVRSKSRNGSRRSFSSLASPKRKAPPARWCRWRLRSTRWIP